MKDLLLARDLALVLLTAFIGGLAAKKLRLPLLVGYLVGGMVIGNLVNRFIPMTDAIQGIAQVGVAFLLFALGLEFSLQRLKQLGDVIVFGSFIQIAVTALIGLVIFPLLGMDFYTSLFLGCIFALSSTAVVVKSLSDRGELETLHGEISAGWLFMQDLYTLPLVIFLPAVGKITKFGVFDFASLWIFVKSILLSVISFWLVIILGKKVIPAFIDKIADFRSRELVLVASVVLCLAFAFLFQTLGLSFAIGAFIAGVLVASSSAHHGIFAEIRPLRDLFSIIFFVSLGFMFNPALFFIFWPKIITLALLVIFLKFIISFILVVALGYHSKTAFLVGISLISVGEFAFILALSAVGSSLITGEAYMIILMVSFITLVVSVPAVAEGENLYYKLKNIIRKYIPYGGQFLMKLDNQAEPGKNILSQHVVVLGYGRVGKYICQALRSASIPYLVIDYNHQIVKHLRDTGTEVIYGDPAEIDVLHFANVKEAKVIILAYADRHMQEVVVGNILSINPDIKLVCRVHFEEDQKKFKSLGVNVVVQPEFEAAVSMTVHILRLFDMPVEEIHNKIKELKLKHEI